MSNPLSNEEEDLEDDIVEESYERLFHRKEESRKDEAGHQRYSRRDTSTSGASVSQSGLSAIEPSC